MTIWYFSFLWTNEESRQLSLICRARGSSDVVPVADAFQYQLVWKSSITKQLDNPTSPLARLTAAGLMAVQQQLLLARN